MAVAAGEEELAGAMGSAGEGILSSRVLARESAGGCAAIPGLEELPVAGRGAGERAMPGGPAEECLEQAVKVLTVAAVPLVLGGLGEPEALVAVWRLEGL